MRALLLAALAALTSGCALVFQTRSGKSCFPAGSHVCNSLKDLDR